MTKKKSLILALLYATVVSLTACGAPHNGGNGGDGSETIPTYSVFCSSDKKPLENSCIVPSTADQACTPAQYTKALTSKDAIGISTVSDTAQPIQTTKYNELGTAPHKYFESELTIDNEHGYQFFDFDTKKTLNINEETAFTKNREWDVAFLEHYGMLTNGGDLPGSLEIAVVKEKGELNFATFTMKDAAAIKSSMFRQENVIEDKNCDKGMMDTRGSGNREYKYIRSASLLPRKYDSTTHLPVVTPGVFYVIRNTSKTWWFKFRVSKYSTKPKPKGEEGITAEGTTAELTIDYQRLDSITEHQ